MDPRPLPKILYIDDTPTARQLVRRMLAQDYQFLEASDPLTGIELAQSSRPDLILIDINMPELSGREVATRLRTLLPGTPLVALTADTTAGSRERALAAGCMGYMNKPIDVDTFLDEIQAYLRGKRDMLGDAAAYVQAYQDELVERLENKVRELSRSLDRNTYLNEQNQQMIAVLQRRQRLLEAGRRVGHNVTSILDLDTLLHATVDIVCEAFEFDYAGIYLLDGSGDWAVLRAGHGQAGEAMLAAGHRLAVQGGRASQPGEPVIVQAIRLGKAQVVLDVKDVPEHITNPFLSRTRSEMALPLLSQQSLLGAITVQSNQPDAFSDDDITALQGLADQIAVAIQNAQLLRDLESANRELLRTKTFEAIATATGEAIHWVGNKAAPIPGSALRVREDLLDLAAVFQALLGLPAEQRQQHPFWEIWQQGLAAAAQRGGGLGQRAERLLNLPPNQLQLAADLDSMLEDLDIIQQSAHTILDIKEDLIGPARLQQPKPIYLPELIQETLHAMNLPAGVVTVEYAPEIQYVLADARQMGQVFNNLIKNAWEALEGNPAPHIRVRVGPAPDELAAEGGMVLAQIIDNGPGMSLETLDKIWVSFYTTKGHRGGTGLGLPACMQIVHQASGKIWADSHLGEGTVFSILLPGLVEQNHIAQILDLGNRNSHQSAER